MDDGHIQAAGLLQKSAGALKAMQAQLVALEEKQYEPIAIVGMACRLPGGGRTPERFWSMLDAGLDGICEVPSSRWDLDAFYDPDPGKEGKMYTREGGFVDGLDQFDPAIFGISPREALSMDPQQRMLLETSWEALEHAGIAPDSLTGSDTGVFVGISSQDYFQHTLVNRTDIDAYSGTGVGLNVASGRISYVLGLQGPNSAVDTACSSSLVSLHMAICSLRAGECSMALAGGVNAILNPMINVYFCKLGALSPDSRCKTFDASANGYARGEGCGMIVLKRLSDARAAGDRVMAVLRGSAINHDGRSGGLTVPNGPAQKAVVRSALRNARLKPEDVSYIEAHGTGTPLGDPIELHALIDVFARDRPATDPLTVGSVKTNIGHLEAAAGIAGVIKVVLAMQNERIPQHLHLAELNPHISLDGAAIRFPTTPLAWPSTGRPRIAGVSSFGISGTNAHVVLEEAPRDLAAPLETAPVNAPRAQHLLPLAAKSPEVLSAMASALHEYLVVNPDASLEMICRTVATGRARLPVRAVVKASNGDQMADRLQALAFGGAGTGVTVGTGAVAGRPRIAFLFSGQGAQYPGMGRALYRQEPRFREALDRADASLAPHLGCSIIEVMHSTGAPARINRTEFTQPALFALEYALAALWRSWGVEPDVVMGHSVGEFAAACVAGVLSLEHAAELIAVRGRLMQALPEGGAMAAVFAPLAVVEAQLFGLERTVGIAAANAPRNTVVSGEQAGVDALLQRLGAQGVQSVPLNVSHAFHSHLMDPMLEELRRVAGAMQHRPPTLRLVSNVTGSVAGRDVIDADYWAEHARRPVQFEQGLRAAAEAGCDTFIEIGPHATLMTMGQQIVTGENQLWLASLRRGADDWDAMSDALAALSVRGAPIAWSTVFEATQGRPVPLPTYPFARERFWIERRTMPQGGNEATGGIVLGASLHPLLGRRVSNAGRDILFQSALGANAPAWLADHAVAGRPIFPATGYWEIALAAGRAASTTDQPLGLADVAVEAPLLLADGAPSTVQTVLQPQADGFGFEIHSLQPDGGWRRHAAGRIVRQQGVPSAPVDPATLEVGDAQDVPALYARMRDRAMQYGPCFTGIAALRCGDRSSLAEIRRPDALPGSPNESLRLHPALTDACLQTLGATLTSDATPADRLWLPVALERLEVVTDCLPNDFLAHATLRESAGGIPASDMLVGDVDLRDRSGALLARIVGIRLRQTSLAVLESAISGMPRSVYHRAMWDEAPLPTGAAAAGGAVLLLADRGGLAARIAAALRERGAAVREVAPDAGDSLAPLVADPVDGQPITRILALQGLDLAAGVGRTDADIAAGAALTRGELLQSIQTLAALPSGTPSLTLVTCGAQSVAAGPSRTAPEAALVWGLGRVAQSELPGLQVRLADLDPADIPGSVLGLVDAVLRPDGENQIAWRHKLRYAARLSVLPTPATSKRPLVQLQIPRRGDLGDLVLAPVPAQSPAPGQVKIGVHATGMNFRDLLNALDMYPGEAGPLGGECAGVVLAVADDVDGLAVGDRVTGIAAGSFRTEVLADARQVAVFPGDMSFADAATLPITFLTAHYALNRLGRLQPGERVLIHAAAGGVGQAAVQLALNAGAEIFATAGDPEKRALLHRQGVAHVLDSRSVAFADEIMRITGGEGIDLVLNSLVGEAIGKSLGLLRAGGRFLEIGKMDLLDAERLRAYSDIEYHTIALDGLSADEPAMVGEMLAGLMREFAAGRLAPLSWHGFPLERAVDAFRFMQQAKHVGKIVLTQDAAANRPMPVRNDGTYLVTGGAGALGLLVADHLAARGAGAVALMGRSAPSDAVKDRLAALEARGCRAMFLRADVADREGLAAALAQLTEAGLPALRGVVHAAGLLDDGIIAQQDATRFDRVMAPKVAGAWNLHELTREHPIELFVLFSSAAATMGAAGQSNYAAANAFLDALASYRQARGLPASSIAWGPWASGGMAVSLEDSGTWAARGMEPIGPEDGMAMLDRILDAGSVGVMVLPIDWPHFLTKLAPGAISPLLAGLAARSPGSRAATTGATEGSNLVEELAQLPDASRRPRLLEVVEQHLLRVLGMGPTARIDPRQPLNDLGIDSLMAVELRNVLARAVGQQLPATLLFDYPNVAALTGYLADTVLKLSDEPPVQGANNATALAGLGADELEASLEAELQRAGF